MQGMWSQEIGINGYGSLCGFELQEEEDSCSPSYFSAEDKEFCIDGKRVGIVGSRDWKVWWEKDEWDRDIRCQDLSEIEEFVGSLPSDVTIVSGGAQGVDKAAKQAASKFKLSYKEWPADWKLYGKQAGFIRNHQIVNDCDIIICFWNGYSQGTKHTIDIANDRGVRVIVIKP